MADPKFIYRDPNNPITIPSTSNYLAGIGNQYGDMTGVLNGTEPVTPVKSSPTVSSFVPYSSEETKKIFESGVNLGKGPAEGPWYQNADMLGSIAGLGAAFAQLAALPSSIDYAKTQSAALKQNIATAKEEQARRNRNISAFNAFKG